MCARVVVCCGVGLVCLRAASVVCVVSFDVHGHDGVCDVRVVLLCGV